VQVVAMSARNNTVGPGLEPAITTAIAELVS
jgi:hypothetical protein